MPSALPVDPRTQPMPAPFSEAWREWLPTTHRMNLASMIAAAGCDLRGCRVEHAWDDEHACRVFYHNGTPITWSTYQRMVPAPSTDHEAFFRAIWDLHAEDDGRAVTPVPQPVPAGPAAPDPAEKTAVDSAYAERDMCVSLIARLAVACGFRAHVAEDATQEAGWRHVVFVELPTGQVSWHVHDREMPWFASLPRGENKWDGHDTREKYRRVLDAWPWEPRR